MRRRCAIWLFNPRRGSLWAEAWWREKVAKKNDMMVVKAQESQVIDLLLRSYLLNPWVDVCEISLNIHCNDPGTMKKKSLKSGKCRIKRSSRALPSLNVLAKTVGNMMRNRMPDWTPVSSPLFFPVRIVDAARLLSCSQAPPFLISPIRKGISLKAHFCCWWRN